MSVLFSSKILEDCSHDYGSKIFYTDPTPNSNIIQMRYNNILRLIIIHQSSHPFAHCFRWSILSAIITMQEFHRFVNHSLYLLFLYGWFIFIAYKRKLFRSYSSVFNYELLDYGIIKQFIGHWINNVDCIIIYYTCIIVFFFGCLIWFTYQVELLYFPRLFFIYLSLMTSISSTLVKDSCLFLSYFKLNFLMNKILTIGTYQKYARSIMFDVGKNVLSIFIK